MNTDKAKDTFAKAIIDKIKELSNTRDDLRILHQDIEEYLDSIERAEEELREALYSIDRAADVLSEYT